MIECYKVQVRLRRTKDDGTGCLEQYFISEGIPSEAVQAAVAWAKNRLESLSDMYNQIEAVDLWRFGIETPQNNGLIGSRNLYSVFSWQKGDIDSLDQKLDSLYAQIVS